MKFSPPNLETMKKFSYIWFPKDAQEGEYCAVYNAIKLDQGDLAPARASVLPIAYRASAD
ncbi:hypothetical protein ACTXT7_014262, partial [Hymenolepis weldensis]